MCYNFRERGGGGGEGESGCVGKAKKRKKHFLNLTVVMLYLSHLKGTNL